MIILVNWVTNFRPPKFQKSSILTPCFQILGNTLMVGWVGGGKQFLLFTGLIVEPCTELASIMGQATGRMKLLMEEKTKKYKNNTTNLKDAELNREMGEMGVRDG